MKKILTLTLFISFIFCFANKAEAKGIPIPVNFGGLEFSTIYDLPNTEEFTDDKGNYVNLGCAYKQLSLVWVPMWNWEVQYCFTIEGNENECYLVDKAQVEEIVGEYFTANNIELPGASPSFWNKIGGKIVWLLVIGFFIIRR